MRQSPREIVRALRPHQWLKNLLVFLPAVTSFRLTQLDMLGPAIVAFFAFCLAASAAYVSNDLIDLKSDRLHPTKRRRPFAAGTLSIGSGMALVISLLTLAMALALTLKSNFAAVLAVYLVLAGFYSFVLKKIVFLDVMTLSALYTLRVLAGSIVTNIPLSLSTVMFCVFLFLDLALLKRFAQLNRILRQPEIQAGASVANHQITAKLGKAFGALSVAVLILYAFSPQALALYSSPHRLGFLAVLILFWLLRLWSKAERQLFVDDDPIAFVIKDAASYVLGLIGILILYVAR